MDQKIDMRTREGRALAASSAAAEPVGAGLSSISAPVEGSGPLEVVAPSGRRITRETRRGFGNQGQKLAVPPREGYFRYWFNDAPGRVDGAKESGYTHVLDPATGRNMSLVVGVKPDGSPLLAYLLEIPQEWRDDDAAVLEEKNREKEEAIKKGAQAREMKDGDKFYPTAQGRRISITRS